MGNEYDFYNLVERCIIDIELSDTDKGFIERHDIYNVLIKEIKGLSMCLSRFKPADWNKFLDVVIK